MKLYNPSVRAALATKKLAELAADVSQDFIASRIRF
jgi:hypothetical protein